jgi:hypothetical protein
MAGLSTPPRLDSRQSDKFADDRKRANKLNPPAAQVIVDFRIPRVGYIFQIPNSSLAVMK